MNILERAIKKIARSSIFPVRALSIILNYNSIELINDNSSNKLTIYSSFGDIVFAPV